MADWIWMLSGVVGQVEGWRI